MKRLVLPLLLVTCIGCTGGFVEDGPTGPPFTALITAVRDSAEWSVVSVALANPSGVRVEIDLCIGQLEVYRQGEWEALSTTWGAPPIVCTGSTQVLQPKSTTSVDYRASSVLRSEQIRFIGQGDFAIAGSTYEPQIVKSPAYTVTNAT